MTLLAKATTLIILLAIAGCTTPDGDQTNDLQPTRCTGASALIGLLDGILQSRCGCSEGVQQVGIGTTLTCTVSAGTLIVFDFSGSQNPHQIISTGSPAFISSQPYIPSMGLEVPTHSVILSSTGSYSYYDAFNPTQVGKIVVQ